MNLSRPLALGLHAAPSPAEPAPDVPAVLREQHDTHTSGLPRPPADLKSSDPANPYAVEDVEASLVLEQNGARQRAPRKPPGDR